ncbi:MAG: shikimate dehydrogenase [Campylobacterota bacterium]
MRKLFAVFGDPVSHSKSPLMHNLAMQNLGLDACYTRYRLSEGTKLREKMFALGLSGANVTVPHKNAAFLACDRCEAFAARIQTVNTIVVKEDKLIGYNTDADGFMLSIKDFSKEKILLLGAGGTAKAIAAKMDELGLNVTVLNRSAGRLSSFDFCDTYDWQSFQPGAYDLVINTTSAGLSDDNLPLPADMLEALAKEARGFVDVIYGRQTPFLACGYKHGLMCKDGADMLLYQGVLAFEKFFDDKCDKIALTTQMKKAFNL